MAIFNTIHCSTEIKALNMPFTNNTLVVAKHKGVNINFLIHGKQIAETISNKTEKKRVYREIKKEYRLYKEIFN